MPSGGLFTEYFLIEGVIQNAGWTTRDDPTILKLREELAALVYEFQARHTPNEAETERDLIEPILRLLGWADFLPQQTAARKGRSDVPDYLLFKAAEDKVLAGPLPSSDKYKFGVTILEAKAWDLSLDRQ